MVPCVGVSWHNRVRRSGRHIVTAYDARGSAFTRLSGNRVWLERRLSGDSLNSILPCQREWDRANGHEQKQVKSASDEVRFGTVVYLFFHRGVVFWGFL